MDFFGIGFLELLLILVILVVVVGPEKVPELARRMGKAVRTFRGATTQLTQEIEREVRDTKEGLKPDLGLEQDPGGEKRTPSGVDSKDSG